MSRVEQTVYPSVGFSRLTLVVLMFVGALSLLSLYLGFDAMLSDNMSRATIYLTMGTSGFALIGYMFFRAKPGAEGRDAIPRMDIATTLECQSCGFKRIRPFQRGDFMFKEAEECSRCKGRMFIEKIFGRERPKRR